MSVQYKESDKKQSNSTFKKLTCRADPGQTKNVFRGSDSSDIITIKNEMTGTPVSG
jgi:hypothetical protein